MKNIEKPRLDVFQGRYHGGKHRLGDAREAGDVVDNRLIGFDKFVEKAHRLKALYADKITLLVGLETDYVSSLDLDGLDALLEKHAGRIEYIVGSIHHVNGIPIDFDKETFDKHTYNSKSVPQVERNRTDARRDRIAQELWEDYQQYLAEQ